MSVRVSVTVPAVLLLLAAALAGCIDGGGPGPSGLLAGPEGPAGGLATLAGRVFTTGLDPVQQASVQLVMEEDLIAQTRTGDAGDYRLSDLEPGTYRLQVSAACCKQSVRLIDIQADEVASADLHLEPFRPDDLQEPRVDPHEWRGFLACTFRWPTGGVSPVGGFNVCGAVELFAPNSTGDDFLRRWEIGPGLKSVVGALEWRAPGAALGDELAVYMEVSGRPLDPPLYVAEQGRSPIEFRTDSGDVIARYDEEVDGEDIHQYDFANVEDPLELMYRIFAGGDLNVVYQQQFTMYWDLYYWEPAPEGATALPDL